MRTCIGCEAEVVPPACVLGVGLMPSEVQDQAEALRKDGIGAYVVCLDCWRDPAHRKINLKLHFFEWGTPQAERALLAAGSSTIGG